MLWSMSSFFFTESGIRKSIEIARKITNLMAVLIRLQNGPKNQIVVRAVMSHV